MVAADPMKKGNGKKYAGISANDPYGGGGGGGDDGVVKKRGGIAMNL